MRKPYARDSDPTVTPGLVLAGLSVPRESPVCRRRMRSPLAFGCRTAIRAAP